jgi:hypothetical protein
MGFTSALYCKDGVVVNWECDTLVRNLYNREYIFDKRWDHFYVGMGMGCYWQVTIITIKYWLLHTG